MSRPDSTDSAAESRGPLPYELYVRLGPLAASWPTDDDGGPGSVVACCGFQAAELTLRLIGDALEDERPAAFPQQRIARFVEHLVDGLELTCRLLRHSGVPEIATTTREDKAPSSGFAVLSHLERDQVDQVTRRFAVASAGLPFEIGIEGQLEAVRRHQGLPAIGDDGTTSGLPVLDYTAVVAPETVFALREPTPYGPEDHLFSTAHQITECWLHIAHHLLDLATAEASQRRWSAAAAALRNASDTLTLAIQAGQLLDLMVLADYHPLRVCLRDGSGAQSRAVRQLPHAVRGAARPLWDVLETDNLSLLDVLDRPTDHVGLHEYLNGLKTIGKRIQGFLFEHYLLALGVLGTHSLGSAGYAIRKLSERAARPLFPEINQAHHDYVMMTNFRHGETSGLIVLRNELAQGWNPYEVIDGPTACPRDIIDARIADYFRFIEERKSDEWVRLFDPVRGQLHDVPGTRPYLGEAHLRVFIKAMFNAFTEMRGTHSSPHIDGNTANVEWRFEAVSYNGQRIAFDGREEFLFAEDGRILTAVADWSPSFVAQQWRDGLDSQRRRSGPLGRRLGVPPSQTSRHSAVA